MLDQASPVKVRVMELPLPFSRDANFIGRDTVLESLDYNGITILYGASGNGCAVRQS